MSRTVMLLALGALAACGRSGSGSALAQASGERHESTVTVAPAPAIPDPVEFVGKAQAGDLFEVQSGRLAQARAADPRVKLFADVLVADHTRASQDLKKAIAESGRSIAGAGVVSPEQQATLAGLQAAPAGAFDRAYVQAQVKAHEDALASLQRYAQDGDVPSLKAYAATAASAVRRHYEHASDLLEQLP